MGRGGLSGQWISTPDFVREKKTDQLRHHKNAKGKGGMGQSLNGAKGQLSRNKLTSADMWEGNKGDTESCVGKRKKAKLMGFYKSGVDMLKTGWGPS